MKYSVRGNLTVVDRTDVINLLNDYTLWKLEQNPEPNEMFIFEAWVNTEVEKTNLFEELKPFVTQPEESIDWHECSHDQIDPQPCVISEEYRG